MKNIAHLYENPKTFVQWLGGVEHVKENNSKPERLRILNNLIGLPFDQNYDFDIFDCIHGSGQFKPFLKEYGHKICVLRLVPKRKEDSWLRMRGLTVEESLKWMEKQNINVDDYFSQFAFHSEDPLWSATFVVNKSKIIGEIIKGGHYQLTRGFDEVGKPIQFVFDFTKWRWSRTDKLSQAAIKKMIAQLRVGDTKNKNELARLLGAKFSHDYLNGYFEVDISKDYGLRFGDYNRILAKAQKPPKQVITGTVRVITKVTDDFQTNDVLVASTTSPDLLPLMAKAAAVITDQGGILSHAAIVTREMGIACLVGTGSATKLLKNGDVVNIDVRRGTASVGKKIVVKGASNFLESP